MVQNPEKGVHRLMGGSMQKVPKEDNLILYLVRYL